MRLPVLSDGKKLLQRPVNPSVPAVQPQGDPCPGYKHAQCDIRAAACLLTLPAGPEAAAACLAAIGASDCYPCWFPS
jgi:hypothetical protein